MLTTLTKFSVQGHKWVKVLIRSVLRVLTISAYQLYIGAYEYPRYAYERHLFLPFSRTVSRLQVILQILIVEVCLGTTRAFLVPYKSVIIWPLFTGLLMGAQILFCIEDLGAVFAFDRSFLSWVFLCAFNLPRAGNFLLQPS